MSPDRRGQRVQPNASSSKLPAKGEPDQVLDGKTPELTIDQAYDFLRSIDVSNVLGVRDRAIIAIMLHAAAPSCAVAKLKRGSFYYAHNQWCLRFEEGDSKSREIHVHQDLQEFLSEYLEAAGMRQAPRGEPLFHESTRREKRLLDAGMTGHTICRMLRRRLKDSGRLSRRSDQVAMKHGPGQARRSRRGREAFGRPDGPRTPRGSTASSISMVCREKLRLTEVYTAATSAYFRATAEIGSKSGEEFHELLPVLQAARAACIKARHAIRHHKAKHGC